MRSGIPFFIDPCLGLAYNEYMKLSLYNTLTRKQEDFDPIDKSNVSLYHCGPTVYWTQHLGNMRAVVMADVVTRTLEYLGYNVTLVRNYTDVGHLTSDADHGEDKMEKAAKRDKLSPEEIAQKYIDVYDADTAALNVRQPNVAPRATDHIEQMIEMVQKLLDEGFAYTTDLAVYFDVSKKEDYTKLSKQVLEDNLSGAGTGEVADKQKKNPADFALWFFKAGAHEHALQTWPSSFESPLVENGEGFPGWHIECSAMSRAYLGDTLDIHMGGVEHIPVHHTNEIAQSESATGKPFANIWLHNEHLTVDGGKMSKSEGTSFILQDILDKGFTPAELRYFFLGAQYRSRQNFTWDALEGASNTLNKLYVVVQSLPQDNPEVSKEYKQQFEEKLSDDFNTPQALAVMWDMLKSNISDNEKYGTLLDFDNVLGLDLAEVAPAAPVEVPEEVQTLLEEREQARKDNDFNKSDELRNKIKELGFTVEDTSEGQTVK